jgi:uncharacterized protein
MSKPSRYNHFQAWQNGYRIAFNARTGAVALMTEDNYRAYIQLTEKLEVDGNGASLSVAESELLKQLEYGSFMRPDNMDEFQRLKFIHGSARYDPRVLGLVIAPTMACNMACPYCFESNKTGKMKPEIVEAIIGLVDRQAKSLDKVDVDWYGGEPLLAMDVIEDLSQSLIDLGREKHFAYVSSIITNGYLLSKDVVDKLRSLNVLACQVTFDGPEALHNQRRPLKNGKNSFRTILENLKYAASKMMVSVRVNVDKNLDRVLIGELLAELKGAGLQDQAAIYFGQLEASTITCAAIAESCYDTVAFSEVEIEFYRLLLDEGFRIQKLPSPSALYCMAQHINGFLVDPEGNLYRCWNHVGDVGRAMGNIKDPIDLQHSNFTRLFYFDPFDDERCKNCDILPLCMGGCPAQRADRGLAGDRICQSWRHNLTPMLEVIARSRQQQAKSSVKEQS